MKTHTLSISLIIATILASPNVLRANDNINFINDSYGASEANRIYPTNDAYVMTSATSMPNADNDTLSTITVTGDYAVTRYLIDDLDSMGANVTVLTESDFKKRNAVWVSDVLQTTPSINIAATGGRGAQTSAFLRGANADQVAVIVDGVKINPATGDAVDFGRLSLAHVERIEILRGEQSVLWGSDAMGGVIAITTKNGKAAHKPLQADISVGAGSHATYDQALSLYGRQDDWYYALNLDNSQSDGISSLSQRHFHYPSDNGVITTGGAKEADGNKHKQGSIHLGYEWDNGEIALSASQSRTQSDFDSNLVSENTTFPVTVVRENTLKIQGQLDGQSLSQRAFAHRMDTRLSTENTAYSMQNDSRSFHAGYQATLHLPTTGAITQDVTGLLDYQDNQLDTANYTERKRIKQTSAALAYHWYHEDAHSLTANLRHDNNSQFDNALTYQVSGSYQLDEQWRLKGVWGTAIKNPTIFDYYGYFGNYQPNPSLKPEKSRGGELGLAFQDNTKQHTASATYFVRHVDDLISSNATWTGSVNNEGKSTIKGLELSYQGDINEALSAYANYTYTDSQDAEGEQLLRRPKHQANAGATYQVNKQLSLNLNARYVGNRMDIVDNDNSNTTTVDKLKIPSYHVTDIGAHYQINPQMTVSAQVNNVFDKRYENVVGYGQPERTVYLGFKAAF